MTRRTLLAALLVTLASCSSPDWSSRTYVYKTVDGLEINAEVHAFDDDVVRPAVIWIHGGALIFGNRGGVSGVIKDMLKAGYVVVSIDYRLAPETRLPSIVEDVEDAFTWVRTRGPELFNVDPTKIAVMGSSAGGYLTLATGFRVEPRPTVLVSFWGYGDLVGDWYSQPSPHPRHNRRAISSEEAYAQVGGPPISDSRERAGHGEVFYNYTRQNGIWPVEVSGWDPHSEPERFYPFMPLMNVTGDYPPTMLIHGTDDTDVPYEQSLMMASLLDEHGVANELVTLEGAEHGFGWIGSSTRRRARAAALDWVDRHLR